MFGRLEFVRHESWTKRAKFSMSHRVHYFCIPTSLKNRNEVIKTRYSSIPATCLLCGARPTTCLCKIFLLHVPSTCVCYMSLLHVPASCPYYMSLQNVPASCPYYMSLLHVPATCPFYVPLLHVPASCPYYMSLQNVPAPRPLISVPTITYLRQLNLLPGRSSLKRWWAPGLWTR